MERRIEQLEERVEKLETEVNKQGKEFAVTEVYVKEIYKKMESIASSIEAIKTKSNTRMERYIEKFLWVIIGIAGTYIATKLNIK